MKILARECTPHETIHTSRGDKNIHLKTPEGELYCWWNFYLFFVYKLQKKNLVNGTDATA